MRVPSRSNAAAQTTKDTEVTKSRSTRPAEQAAGRLWRPSNGLLVFVIFVSLVADPSLRGLSGGASAQSTITDAELGRASGARMVAVRGLAGGAIARLPGEGYI